jgi:hypothetical protein
MPERVEECPPTAHAPSVAHPSPRRLGSRLDPLESRAFEAENPDRTRLEIWNPVPASFTDFGVAVDGAVEIPNVWPRYRSSPGAISRQTIAEANQLGLRVSICRPLLFPITAPLFIAGLRFNDTSAFALGCYAQGAIPLHARALVHMQSAARRSSMGL